MMKMIQIYSILLLLMINSANASLLSNNPPGNKNIYDNQSFPEPAALTECVFADSNVTGNDFELVVQIELTRFEGRSHRPYVAVWIENEKSEPVRTLALWFNDYRWLPDLKRWYSKHYEKILRRADIDAISGATRPAGKYTLKWDGKDYTGELLQEGKYTVFIEVARERGTYQLIRQEFLLNGQHQRYELASGIEVSSAVVEYRKTESSDPIP